MSSLFRDIAEAALLRIRGQRPSSVAGDLGIGQTPAAAPLAARTPQRLSASTTLGISGQSLGDQLQTDMAAQLQERRKKTMQAVSPGNAPMYASADIFGRGF